LKKRDSIRFDGPINLILSFFQNSFQQIENNDPRFHPTPSACYETGGLLRARTTDTRYALFSLTPSSAALPFWAPLRDGTRDKGQEGFRHPWTFPLHFVRTLSLTFSSLIFDLPLDYSDYSTTDLSHLCNSTHPRKSLFIIYSGIGIPFPLVVYRYRLAFL
jgi:hypothetical protein